MLSPELLLKMRGIVEAKRVAIAAAEMMHATADSRIREAVSETLSMFLLLNIMMGRTS